MSERNIPHPPDVPPRKASLGNSVSRRGPFGDPPARGVESAPCSDYRKRNPISLKGRKKAVTSPPSLPSYIPSLSNDVDEEVEVRKMEARKQLEAEFGRALTKYEAQAIMIFKECDFEETKLRKQITSREGSKRHELVRKYHISPLLQFTENDSRNAIERSQLSRRSDLHKDYSMTSRVIRFAANAPPQIPKENTPPSSANSITSRYKKTKKILGKGAFGTVYEGYDAETGKYIAIKEVIFSPVCLDKNIQRVTEEVKVMKKLTHPNIVEYVAAERQGVVLNIYMELVSGGSVASALSYLDGGFPESSVRIYTKQICCGLQYLHDSGIIHRDIKGDNILIDKTNGVVKLADFNSSKSLEMSMNHGIKSIAGTPWFMAPEVIDPTTTFYGLPADIWSLGIAVIEMLTGSPPFINDFSTPASAMIKIAGLKDPYQLPSGLSDCAEAFLSCCLLRDPAARHTVLKLSKHAFVCSYNSLQGVDDGNRAPKYQLKPLSVCY